MNYGSVCSGIEAASVAWHPLGWRPSFFSEIESFPRAVLAHHYPDVPCHGDFTTIRAGDYTPIDLLVGGTPCQSFSVAGLRKGLDDPRGNLMLGFGALAQRLRPRWLVWENVPGVLSSNGGRDFGTFLGMLGILGYGFAYRVLDAQYFGVPQRRRRVFVVGCLGDWRSAAAVLFERHSLQGHPAPRREARQGTTVGTLAGTSPGGGWRCGADEAAAGQLVPICVSTGQASAEIGIGIGTTLNCNHEAPYIAHTLRGEGFDASEDGTGRGTPLVPVAFSIMPMNSGKDYKARPVEVTQPLMAGGPVGGNQGGDFIVQPVAYRTTGNDGCYETGDQVGALTCSTDPNAQIVAFSCKDHGADAGDIAPTLRAMGHGASHANAGGQVAVAYSTKLHNTASNQAGKVYKEYTTGLDRSSPPPALLTARQVRRLTPRECERLQGFPDDYTLIPVRGKPAADGPRYKALGNSMAVPVMRWIGDRIQQADSLTSPRGQP